MPGVFYEEDFGGSGSMVGTSPSVGFAGHVYSASGSGLVKAAGMLTAPNFITGIVTIGSDSGTPPSTPNTSVEEFDVTWSWLSPSSLAGLTATLAQLDFWFADSTAPTTNLVRHGFSVVATSGNVQISADTRGGPTVDSAPLAIAPNTLYEITCSARHAGNSMSITGVAGATATGTPAFGRTCTPVDGVDIALYPGNAIGPIVATDTFQPTAFWTNLVNALEEV